MLSKANKGYSDLNPQEDDRRTFYLGHHTSEACQRVTATGCPSSPVDLIVIKECECVGTIRHQHGLEGVYLKNVQKPS